MKPDPVWVFVFFLAAAFISPNALAAETWQYTVEKRDGAFEIRSYPSYIVAQTRISSDFEKAGNIAFKRLAGYINGNNRAKQKIAMTAPVTQKKSEKIAMTAPVTQEKAENDFVVAFVMPKAYSLETLPEPLDPKVELRLISEKRMAVIRYSGRWTQKRYLKKKALLEQKLKQWNAKPVGEPVWARYNPPFTPWFMRRNEILIPIAQK